MGYKKPLLFAGLGMLAGAASVALLTALMPSSPEESLAQQATDSMELSASAVHTPSSFASIPATADNAVITGPRSASRPSSAQRQPANGVQLASLGPAEQIPGLHQETIKVQRGDTLLGMLVEAGVNSQEAHDSIAAMKQVYNPRDLRPGDEITLTFLSGPQDREFYGFSLEADPVRTVYTAKENEGGFSANELKAKLSEQTFRFEGKIHSSLFLAATRQGVPLDALQELIKIFSYDVDFQRDIQDGDSFQILFKQKATPDGQPVGDAYLQFASLTLSGKVFALYRFEDADGSVDYYNEKGQNVRKALLRTPINGARLSSGFGMRTHPVLGYSKMHKGVDFAAPTGTPIYAAGDATVEVAGPFSSYGNYVRLRHTSDYATAYGHMNAVAKGLKPGMRVRQGDVIGYVGSTGRATGPHLHYEILKGGSQVNPIGVRFPSGRTLAGKDLKNFLASRKKMEDTYAALPVSSRNNLALSQNSDSQDEQENVE